MGRCFLLQFGGSGKTTEKDPRRTMPPMVPESYLVFKMRPAKKRQSPTISKEDHSKWQ
jgi:hypothetical protein